jgi:hypothetical protein
MQEIMLRITLTIQMEQPFNTMVSQPFSRETFRFARVKPITGSWLLPMQEIVSMTPVYS